MKDKHGNILKIGDTVKILRDISNRKIKIPKDTAGTLENISGVSFFVVKVDGRIKNTVHLSKIDFDMVEKV